MSLKLSTGLRSFILGGGSMRKAFSDALLMIYSGAAPTTADLEPTGTLLARITLASATCADDATSTAKQSIVTVSDTTQNHINSIVIAGETFSHTNSGSETVSTVAAALVAAIDASFTVPVVATWILGVICVKSKFPGEDYVISVAGGGGGSGPTLTTEDAPAQVRVNSLQLIEPAAGIITKEAAVWSHAAVATGVAGYFRLVRTEDHDVGSTSTTALRLQGTVSTSGADLNLTSINIVSGATQTIDTFKLTEPTSVS